MTNKKDNTSTDSYHKKLTGFNNWLRWSNLMTTMLVEKNIWNLIKTGPKPASVRIWEQKIKENWIAIGTVTQIIKEGISNNIFNNIIDITDPKEMWEKLCVACSQVGERVIYSILQELLNYLYTNKPKRFEKSVISRFADV